MKKIFFVVMLLQIFSLTGCAGALVGNAGRPNHQQGKEQRSIEQIKADAAITAQIKARYANDVVLRKLNILTYRGVVTLYGEVPTRTVMERAIRFAESVKGVSRVKSGLRLR